MAFKSVQERMDDEQKRKWRLVGEQFDAQQRAPRLCYGCPGVLNPYRCDRCSSTRGWQQ